MDKWLALFLSRVIFVTLIFIISIYVSKRYLKNIGIKTFIIYYFCRLAILWVMICCLEIVPPDLTGWYQHAVWMSDGKIPGIDYHDPYYIGMNLLMMTAIQLVQSPFSICVVFTIIEMLGMLFLYKIIKRLSNKSNAKCVVLLTCCNPVTLMASWLGVQDEVIILFFALFLIWTFLQKWNWIQSIWVIVLSVIFSKILIVFYMLPLTLVKRFRMVFVICGTISGYWLFQYALGIDPFDFRFGRELGIDAQADNISTMTTIGNIWYLIPHVAPCIQSLFFMLALVLVSILFAKPFFSVKNDEQRIKVFMCMYVIYVLVFSLFYKMTFTGYLIPIVPFVFFIFIAARLALWGKIIMGLWLFVMAMKDPLCYQRALFGDIVVFGFGLVSVILTLCVICFVLTETKTFFKKGIES